MRTAIALMLVAGGCEPVLLAKGDVGGGGGATVDDTDDTLGGNGGSGAGGAPSDGGDGQGGILVDVGGFDYVQAVPYFFEGWNAGAIACASGGVHAVATFDGPGNGPLQVQIFGPEGLGIAGNDVPVSEGFFRLAGLAAHDDRFVVVYGDDSPSHVHRMKAISLSGAVLWERSIGSFSGGYGPDVSAYQGGWLVVDRDGYDYLRIDLDGNDVLTQTVTGFGLVTAATDANGATVVAGTYQFGDCGDAPPNTTNGQYVASFAPDGTVNWCQRFAQPSGYPFKITGLTYQPEDYILMQGQLTVGEASFTLGSTTVQAKHENLREAHVQAMFPNATGPAENATLAIYAEIKGDVPFGPSPMGMQTDYGTLTFGNTPAGTTYLIQNGIESEQLLPGAYLRTGSFSDLATAWLSPSTVGKKLQIDDACFSGNDLSKVYVLGRSDDFPNVPAAPNGQPGSFVGRVTITP